MSPQCIGKKSFLLPGEEISPESPYCSLLCDLLPTCQPSLSGFPNHCPAFVLVARILFPADAGGVLLVYVAWHFSAERPLEFFLLDRVRNKALLVTREAVNPPSPARHCHTPLYL